MHEVPFYFDIFLYLVLPSANPTSCIAERVPSAFLKAYSGQVHHKLSKEACDLSRGEIRMYDRRKDIRDRIEKRRKINERRINGAWSYIDDQEMMIIFLIRL